MLFFRRRRARWGAGSRSTGSQTRRRMSLSTVAVRRRLTRFSERSSRASRTGLSVRYACPRPLHSAIASESASSSLKYPARVLLPRTRSSVTPPPRRTTATPRRASTPSAVLAFTMYSRSARGGDPHEAPLRLRFARTWAERRASLAMWAFRARAARLSRSRGVRVPKGSTRRSNC